LPAISVPPITDVMPPYVFAPVSVSFPAASLITVPGPEIVPP